jgi:hypothetical protein
MARVEDLLADLSPEQFGGCGDWMSNNSPSRHYRGQP